MTKFPENAFVRTSHYQSCTVRPVFMNDQKLALFSEKSREIEWGRLLDIVEKSCATLAHLKKVAIFTQFEVLLFTILST